MGLPVMIDEVLYPYDIHPTLYGKLIGPMPENTGMPGIPSPLGFAHWQAPKHGNSSEYTWNTVFQGAQLAIAIAASVAQEQIANKNLEIAESWYSHANYKWNRFKNGYMPLEKQLIKETQNTKETKLDCKAAESRASTSVRNAFKSARTYMNSKAKQLRLCVDDSLYKDLDIQQQKFLVDTRNYNYDDDRWWRDYSNDKRWNRRSAVLNIGRNTASQALEYGRVASQSLTQVGRQIDTAASGLISALGYFGARNDTYAPTAFLGNAGVGPGSAVAGVGKAAAAAARARHGGFSPEQP